MGTLLNALAAGLLLCGTTATSPVHVASGVPDAPEIEQTTVTGVVEEVNREDLTVTILTDSGRILSLSAAGHDVIATLHAGDRVQIQILMEDDAEAEDDQPLPRSRQTEI
ncbi:MAG TPA: hypothetical protein VFA38_06565 [Nitrospirales bacterium]|nr:hypothetical protein [Nitrospirales bacterium]